MGSGTSRESGIDGKWETKAQQMLRTTTNTPKVKAICSLIPFKEEADLLKLIKARPDLETLFALCYEFQKLPGEQSADLSLTDEVKADMVWQVLRFPLGYSTPWDWNWQPPLSGDPNKIAGEFHVAVCRAVFRVPLLDFVRCALGNKSKALSVGFLISAVCEVSSGLQRTFRDLPKTKDIYIEVQKVLQHRYHPLACWIVASSLDKTTDAPYDALAPTINQIKEYFRTCNLDIVLDRLVALDGRLKHINEKYNWGKWSTDLDFWECTSQVLWMGAVTIPTISPYLLPEDREERLSFLRSFESIPRGEVRGTGGKILSFVKRLRRGPHRSASK